MDTLGQPEMAYLIRYVDGIEESSTSPTRPTLSRCSPNALRAASNVYGFADISPATEPPCARQKYRISGICTIFEAFSVSRRTMS